MTPNEIVTRVIQSIGGLRSHVARSLIDRIFRELADEGYVIIEESELRRLQGCPLNSSQKAISSRS